MGLGMVDMGIDDKEAVLSALQVGPTWDRGTSKGMLIGTGDGHQRQDASSLASTLGFVSIRERTHKAKESISVPGPHDDK